MLRRSTVSTLFVVPFLVIAASGLSRPDHALAEEALKPGTASPRPQHIRDILWAWGNPELVKPGKHTVATFVEAGPARRAELLGVPNVVMAGLGLPEDDAEAERLTREVARFRQIIWEITPDGPGVGPPFVYRKTIERVRALAKRYPNLRGVLLDDMSTQQIQHGLLPEHVREVRRLVSEGGSGLKTWGVLYTMSMDRPDIGSYVKELDGIYLCEWHAKKLPQLETNVARCQKEYPGKPIVLGLYLYDYGDGRRMPMDLLELQCRTALKLAHQRRIVGILFVTINNDPQAVGRTANWVRKVGKQVIGKPGGK